MRLTDLQDKDIVDIETGKLIGKIIDISLNDTGLLENLIVFKTKFFISLFSTKKEIIVNWKQIEKIGEDIILVRLNTSEN
ncbi:MAG TPA: YlmC/YmxH family sporulation protein [Bacilli bacterium]|nr:YlmC/YmxH family sporulation protein [Bacilli bacterium]